MGKNDNPYRINKEAVETLASASKENTPQYSEEELNKYKSKSKFKLNPTFKALFVKFWFSGVVCYFFIWGLGMYIPSNLDLLVVTGIGMGFVKDILENNFLRYIADPDGSNNKWMMVPKKSFISLLWNVLYSLLVMFSVFYTYEIINNVLLRATGETNKVMFGVEPISFGLIYLGFDVLFISIKKLLMRIVNDAKKKVEGGV